MNILITGGTGFIGKELGSQLIKNHHRLIVLSRDKNQSLPYPGTLVSWEDLELNIDQYEIDAVINLAGESIAQRWTPRAKRKILESRVQITQKLVRLFQNKKLKVFISASAIGYYGDRGDEVLTEDSGSGSGFLTEVCRAWEMEASQIEDKTRLVILRFGLVLGESGGALPKMVTPLKFGLGGVLGDGAHWMSWIHIADLTKLIVEVLKNDFKGIYNATSPSPIQNKTFTEKLAARFNKSSFLPVPKVVLKTALGEMSEALLASQRVSPRHLMNQKFKFEYENLDNALKSFWKS